MVLFAALSDNVWLAIIAVGALVVKDYLDRKRADGAAKEVEKVHILVNSSMAVQLKISAVALRRIANLTKNEDDIAAAALAEKLHREHEEKQKKVDDKEAKAGAR